MNKKELTKEILNKYLRYTAILKEKKDIERFFDKHNFNIERFENIYTDELSDDERFIVEQHTVNKKPLKSIAYNMSFSYPYIRKRYVDTKEKMRFIISITLTK